MFITGVGNVGSKLIEQIENQKDYLLEHLRLKIRVIALSNSRKMILSENPIDLAQWKELLNKSKTTSDREQFFKHIKELNLRNSIFVDNTASETISDEYIKYLKNNIGVVTCNKIACASSFENYRELKKQHVNLVHPFCLKLMLVLLYQ